MNPLHQGVELVKIVKGKDDDDDDDAAAVIPRNVTQRNLLDHDLKRLRRQRAVLALLWLSALALTLHFFSNFSTITKGTNEKKFFSAALIAALASPVFAITDRKLLCGVTMMVGIVGASLAPVHTRTTVSAPTETGKCFRLRDFPFEGCHSIADPESFVAVPENISKYDYLELFGFFSAIPDSRGYLMDACQLLLQRCDPLCSPTLCNLTVVFRYAGFWMRAAEAYRKRFGIDNRYKLFHALESHSEYLRTSSDTHFMPCNFTGSGPCAHADHSNPRVVHMSIPIGWSIIEGSTYSILFICILLHSHTIGTQSRKSVLCGLIVIAAALIILLAIFLEEGSEWINVYIVVEVYVLVEGWSTLFGLRKFDSGNNWMDSITKLMPTRLRQKLHEVQYFFHPQSQTFFWYQTTVEVIEVALQFFSLVQSAQRTRAEVILIRSALIGLNLIALPLLTWCSVRRKLSMSVILIAEIVVDKLFLLLAVYHEVRLDLINHISFLFPALMITFSIEKIQRAKKVEVSVKCLGFGCGLWVSSGCAFIAYVFLQYSQQASSCISEFGSVASSFEPKLYWSNGLFGGTSCGLPWVHTIACTESCQLKSTSECDKHRYFRNKCMRSPVDFSQVFKGS